ncbi:hypothetical protein FA048_10815 [Pedobacter polaris]|uniref:HTH LytTR-type domain-containing protein n=1 Tax=Pedobacter polaris TaxID=2571273 RepID=A0A4U1CU68_9SPHI|nr:LytTR family transcriptional regulator DNA-binding domain-containing protein [Pedobacter polaris]TKC10660.1 hypothetical protein FA048_10815 [Pedobacter polaris]
MKSIPWYRVGGAEHYPSYRFRILIALIAAQLIVLYEERHSYVEIFSNPYYYIALVISTVIALSLINIVFYISRLLDRYYPWGRSYRLRMPRQLLAGVFLPLMPAILLALLYFACFDINILKTVYFSRYLQQIILLLALLNAYLFYHWHYLNKRKSTPKASLQFGNSTTVTAVNPIDIACVFIEGKNYFALNYKGERLIWEDTISHSMTYLDHSQFTLVRRSFIVNRNAIAKVKILTPKKTKITLIAPLNLDIEVSQRENVYFKKWFVKKDC